MRHANHVHLPDVVTAPGRYTTRSGETVTIVQLQGHLAYGRYPNGVHDTWDRSGRLYPNILPDNDLVAGA